MSEINKKEIEYIQNEEIDLRELFKTILRHKFKIVSFAFITVLFTFIYVLSIPNSYKSFVVLSPQNSGQNVSGGLSSLASLAGVNIGGGDSKDPFTMIQTILNDYSFNEYLIKKYNLSEKLENQNNLVFAWGIDSIYNMLNSKEVNKNTDEESRIFNTINSLKNIVNVSSDKKSNMITLSAELNDRVLAKDLVDIYLKELISKIKAQDMKDIDEQIKYYNKELSSTYDVSLKEQLSKSLSGLYQKKVFSQANDYYFVSKIIDSRVSYVKEKTKPKRALFLVASFVTSIILGIFFVIFLEFIRSDKKDESKNS